MRSGRAAQGASDFLTVAQLADMLGCSPASVRRLDPELAPLRAGTEGTRLYAAGQVEKARRLLAELQEKPSWRAKMRQWATRRGQRDGEGS